MWTLVDAQPSSSVEMAVIDIVFHHGGEFVTKEDGEMVYEMESIDVEEKIDTDTLDVFAMRDHYQALGYEKIKQCWWLVPGRPLQIGRRVLDSDNELLELVFFAERNGNKIHIYYEHEVSVPELVEDCPKLIEMTPTPSQVQTDAATVIDLEDSPQKDIPVKTSPPTETHTTKPTEKPTVNPTNKKTTKPNTKPSAKPLPARPQTRSATRVSPRKTKKKVVEDPASEDDGSSSHDSYDSVEDNVYIPRADDLSSDDEDEDEIRISQARKKDSNRKRGDAMDLKKAREKIMVEDDGLVADSDSDDELGLVFGRDENLAEEDEEDDAYDADSDGKDSWHSLEMKTPPNSEDEANTVDHDTPLSKEGVKFGEVRIEVGMRFKSKRDFIDAVREFTLQEGRRMVIHDRG
ncbi:hypothetical protein PIB30_038862 [Stylosanthes scabra]|uniref:PB1-like domain-containing protein n=1 Tax=Stylosanthes scabra TaxID=79078 RepID=A0ABU6WE51_9FABA|nr:hypothetical protein [Stylosanthes scabra]